MKDLKKNSDGHYFVNGLSGKLVEISGTVVIT